MFVRRRREAVYHRSHLSLIYGYIQMSFGSTAVLSSGKDLSQVPVHIDHDFVLDFLYVDRHFD